MLLFFVFEIIINFTNSQKYWRPKATQAQNAGVHSHAEGAAVALARKGRADGLGMCFNVYLFSVSSFNNAILMAPSASATRPSPCEQPADETAEALFPVAVISAITRIICLSGMLARIACSGLHLWEEGAGIVFLVLSFINDSARIFVKIYINACTRRVHARHARTHARTHSVGIN